jgi:hypothetical protein
LSAGCPVSPTIAPTPREPCLCWSGRTEARIGLRMMPTFPRSSLSFRTVSFPQYGWKAGLSDGACLDVAQLKPARGVRCSSSSLRPSFVHFVTASMAPLCVGPVGSIAHRHEAEYSAYPRGPRSQPGYSVPVGHHLIGPIRPTRGHIAISPHGGLYAMPSLCGSA